MTERIESIQQVEEAVKSAQSEIYRANECVRSMANLCAGKLQSSEVYWGTLKKLKKELENFNMHTGRWKS